MSEKRDELVRAIWSVEAEDHGAFTVGVKSEVAVAIADAILPLLAKAWNEGSRAGWSDRTRSIMGRLTYEEEQACATTNPYGEEPQDQV